MHERVMHERRRRDVRGADPVTVSDGREALHGGAKQAPECLGLRLAKLRVLGSHVRYRAVVLT
jgi:hypothetical protein